MMAVRNDQPDVAAETERRIEEKRRDMEAAERAEVEAAVQQEIAQERRLEAETRRLEELRAESAALDKTVGELSVTFAKHRDEAQRAWNQLGAAQTALTDLAGRIAAAEQRVKALSPNPYAELQRQHPAVDVVLKWLGKLEFADGVDAPSGFVFGGRRIKPSCFGLAQAVDRAIARLGPAQRAEVLRRLSDDELRLGARRVERV